MQCTKCISFSAISEVSHLVKWFTWMCRYKENIQTSDKSVRMDGDETH